jgi:hypothetical protein
LLYVETKDYAVQLPRNKYSVWWDRSDGEYFDGAGTGIYPDGFEPLRLRIKSIRREDARQISWQDAAREGYDSIAAFWVTWVGMHDKPIAAHMADTHERVAVPTLLMQSELAARPDARYDCWAIDFEVV